MAFFVAIQNITVPTKSFHNRRSNRGRFSWSSQQILHAKWSFGSHEAHMGRLGPAHVRCAKRVLRLECSLGHAHQIALTWVPVCLGVLPWACCPRHVRSWTWDALVWEACASRCVLLGAQARVLRHAPLSRAWEARACLRCTSSRAWDAVVWKVCARRCTFCGVQRHAPRHALLVASDALILADCSIFLAYILYFQNQDISCWTCHHSHYASGIWVTWNAYIIYYFRALFIKHF